MRERVAATLDGLVRRFFAATVDLCSQVRAGLPEGTGLDPLQVIVTGNLFRLIEQHSELNGVGYFKHGIGATLWDARKPPLIAGRVDLDLARDAEGLTCYEVDSGRINSFAASVGLPAQPENAIEEAFVRLVQDGTLSAFTDPFSPAPRPVIAGRFCIPRLRQDSEQAWVADLGFELYWGPPGPVPKDYRERLTVARKYLELGLLLYPRPARRDQLVEWSDVEILDDKDIFPQDN